MEIGYDRLMRLRSFVAVLALLGLTSAGVANAEGEPRKAPDHESLSRVHAALEKIQAGAYDEALEQLRAVRTEQPTVPTAAYYEAVALKLKGDLEGAIAAFRSARVIAANAGSPRVEAQALQGSAMTLELIPEKHTEAKAAWEELAAFLESNPSAGVAAVPSTRLEKMKQASETEAAAETVRRAIAAREEELRQQEAARAKKAKKKKSRR